eukprot:g1843.t1
MSEATNTIDTEENLDDEFGWGAFDATSPVADKNGSRYGTKEVRKLDDLSDGEFEPSRPVAAVLKEYNANNNEGTVEEEEEASSEWGTDLHHRAAARIQTLHRRKKENAVVEDDFEFGDFSNANNNESTVEEEEEASSEWGTDLHHRAAARIQTLHRRKKENAVVEDDFEFGDFSNANNNESTVEEEEEASSEWGTDLHHRAAARIQTLHRRKKENAVVEDDFEFGDFSNANNNESTVEEEEEASSEWGTDLHHRAATRIQTLHRNSFQKKEEKEDIEWTAFDDIAASEGNNVSLDSADNNQDEKVEEEEEWGAFEDGDVDGSSEMETNATRAKPLSFVSLKGESVRAQKIRQLSVEVFEKFHNVSFPVDVKATSDIDSLVQSLKDIAASPYAGCGVLIDGYVISRRIGSTVSKKMSPRNSLGAVQREPTVMESQLQAMLVDSRNLLGTETPRDARRRQKKVKTSKSFSVFDNGANDKMSGFTGGGAFGMQVLQPTMVDSSLDNKVEDDDNHGIADDDMSFLDAFGVATPVSSTMRETSEKVQTEVDDLKESDFMDFGGIEDNSSPNGKDTNSLDDSWLDFDEENFPESEGKETSNSERLEKLLSNIPDLSFMLSKLYQE